jgi:hypothetical protein
MTVTVTATAGSASANSYLTVAGGDTIANLQLGTLAWGSASNDDKGRAVISATRYLDELEWIGDRASSTQALGWPRSGITLDGVALSSTAIPEQVEQATFDLANALLTTPTLLSGSNTALGELIPSIPNSSLQSASVDVVSVTFRQGGAPTVLNCLTVVPSLVGTLGVLTASIPKGASGSIRVFRG